jgi:hypothetical protein
LRDGPTAGRSASINHWLVGIERALGRWHDDAPDMIERKFGKRYLAGVSFADLTDDELLAYWAAIECTDDGTCQEQNEVADEIERRGLDV